MSDADLLIKPTLDLLLYDLVTESPAEPIAPSAETRQIKSAKPQFLQRIRQTQAGSASSSSITALQDRLHQAENFYRQKNTIPPIDKHHIIPFADPTDGFYYLTPLGSSLDDTCVLLADSAGPLPDTSGQIEPYPKQPIAGLNRLQQDLRQRIEMDQAIGHTWIAWGQLTHPQQDRLDTAKACAAALGLSVPANLQPDRLFGADLFDLWQPDSQSDQGLIYLLPYGTTPQARSEIIYTKLLPQLVYLLWYRHKIVWAYQQTRRLKLELKRAAALSQQQVTKLPSLLIGQPNLANLQTSLTTNLELFSTYGTFLSELEAQQQTLQTNQQNYDKRQQLMAELDPTSQLDQLQQFSKYTTDKYLAQIQADAASFNPQLRALENITQTIQGILTLEQTKSERLLNQTVASVGVGLAVSQVASAVILAQPPAGLDANAYRFQLAGWSIAWGLGAGLVVWLILRLFR